MKMSNLRFAFLALCFTCTLQSTFSTPVSKSSTRASSPTDWWHSTTVYEVYPRSLQDSDGDGVGDLNGAAERLDYFVSLGVETLWFCPIYQSPMKDFGYDVSNYELVDPLFGTNEDFDRLQAEMEARGMKLVLDFVPNHTSDQHEWFQMSLQRVEPYTDYYIWVDANGYNETGDPIPPNNWISSFGGSAWQWSDERQQFYYHAFLSAQPDLNYRNPAVVVQMQDTIRFWLDKGVDGFRFDAVPYLLEDELLRDEPINPVTGEVSRIYTQNVPGVLDALYAYREVMDQYEALDGFHRIFMAEVYLTERSTMTYYGNETHAIADFPFNFIYIDRLDANFTADDLYFITNRYLNAVPEGKWPNWVLGNHDNSRIATRLCESFVDGMNIISRLLPGTAVSYYGEEIGMNDTYVPPDEQQDTQGRDPERTPMQWTNGENAGFSNTTGSTWLPINPNYITVNARTEATSEGNSHLKVFNLLTKARNNSIIQEGAVEMQVIDNSVFAFTRTQDNVGGFIIAFNVGDSDVSVDLTTAFSNIPASATVYLTSVGFADDVSGEIATNGISLGPQDAIVLQYSS